MFLAEDFRKAANSPNATYSLIRIEENQHEEQERGIADHCGDIGLDDIDFGGVCAN
jgi:hypothetical protein